MSENSGTKQQKETALSKEQLETAKKWLQLVAQARADKTTKQRLIDTPVVVLKEHGINVRPGLDIRVVENTDKVVYLKLPAEAELTDGELDGIVGGTFSEWLSNSWVGDAVMAVAAATTKAVDTLLAPATLPKNPK